VIVVGAGISGVTAAWRLERAGIAVTVLEAEDHVGGKLWSVERDGYRLSRGAAALGGSYETVLRLVDELGLTAQLSPVPATIGVLQGGRMHWLRGEGIGALVDFIRTPLLSPRSKLLLARLARDAWRHRRSVGWSDTAARAAIDTESVGQYCDRRLNPELRDRLVVPLMRAVWVVDGGAMPVVDLYFLLSKFLAGGLLGYRDGIDFVAREAASRLADVRLGARVTRVAPVEGGARVAWSVGGEDREELVDGVVLTMPAPHVPPVYPDLEPELQGILLEGIQQASYGALRFALSRDPGVPGALVVTPASETTVVGSVVFDHLVSPTAAPPGKGVMTAFLDHEWAHTRLDWSDDALIEAVLPEIEMILPGVADMIEFVEVCRWDPATYRPQTGVHRLIARFDAAIDDGRRIQHAGDYLNYAAIEGSAQSGETAARRLISTLRAG
jgi:oxygen-dependent protoporphyrinogen oxidase